MKTSQLKNILIASLSLIFACADNELDVTPEDQNFPFQIILDADEGGDLPNAEDYSIEVTFADYIGSLPKGTFTLSYQIDNFEGDMEGKVHIDQVLYEYEEDDCAFEREINFIPSNDGLSGSILITPDPDLGTVPETFEIVLTLPGNDNTEGSFAFRLTSLETSERVILGPAIEFEYEVLNSDVAGEWEMDIADKEDFKTFKSIFAPLSHDIDELEFIDITGKVAFEFEYGEMQMEIELAEEEEVVSCEDGETEIEIKNKIIEFEADYEADDGELSLEGSHEIIGEDGEAEDEVDFILRAEYTNSEDGTLNLTIEHIVDENNFKVGEELLNGKTVTLKLIKG
ncbi:hypothetical protein [Chryseosolibacter indicus]|uniref:DUF4625 domain-containing protein n=1 Tax=Chryseosolibacter indicus TaxID=2782351 RepID=A0ABS5VT50_9BACT|nr:hypothetical protein [Chryseosolibacter indicus]MBT1704610.1 hypothetical protein [Chryseosolibacter indicus]